MGCVSIDSHGVELMFLSSRFLNGCVRVLSQGAVETPTLYESSLTMVVFVSIHCGSTALHLGLVL